MNTKKEIRKFIVEHSAELAKNTIGYYTCERKIYLTDKDYIEVTIFEDFGLLTIGLCLDNNEFGVFHENGSIYNLNGVWRRFRNTFKKEIAEREKFCWDAKYLAKLKEIYSLL